MKKIDFAVKGTKLPVIPKGTKFNTIYTIEDSFSVAVDFPIDLVSFGAIVVNNVSCIMADHFGYEESNHYILRLSDIEKLAEEQGMYKEEEEKKKSKYHKEIKQGVIIDVYDVLDAYQVESSAVQHAIKKLLMPGERGSKSMIQDLKEAKHSIERAIEKYTNQNCDVGCKDDLTE